MRNRVSLVFVGAVLSLAPIRVQSQTLALTPLSPEQRWDRASMHVTLFTAMFIREGIQAKKSPGQIGRELSGFFGPWTGVTTPAAMAQAINRNWQLWRSLEFSAVEQSDGSVRITTNRPYVAALTRYGVIGVTPAEFDDMFASFHESIASKQGLVFEQTKDSAAVYMTIRRAK